MSNDAHVTEFLPAYALGSLDGEERRRVADHLAVCSACRAELSAYQGVADLLATAAPDAVPPSDLKQRLMARVQPVSSTQSAVLRTPWWQQLARLWQRTSPAWGAISVVLIVVLAASTVLLWRQANPPNAMRTITLEATDAAPNASGTVVVSMDGDHGAIVVDGLDPLDATRQYQVWLIRDGTRTSGGVFSVDDAGYGVLWLSAPGPLSSYDAVGITVEPAGGSPGPTGIKVMGGNL